MRWVTTSNPNRQFVTAFAPKQKTVIFISIQKTKVVFGTSCKLAPTAKFTWKPKDYVEVIVDQHPIDGFGPKYGFTDSRKYVEELDYRKGNLLDVVQKVKDKWDNPGAVSNYAVSRWSMINKNNNLYKYRPNGIIRREFGF